MVSHQLQKSVDEIDSIKRRLLQQHDDHAAQEARWIEIRTKYKESSNKALDHQRHISLLTDHISTLQNDVARIAVLDRDNECYLRQLEEFQQEHDNKQVLIYV